MRRVKGKNCFHQIKQELSSNQINGNNKIRTGFSDLFKSVTYFILQVNIWNIVSYLNTVTIILEKWAETWSYIVTLSAKLSQGIQHCTGYTNKYTGVTDFGVLRQVQSFIIYKYSLRIFIRFPMAWAFWYFNNINDKQHFSLF